MHKFDKYTSNCRRHRIHCTRSLVHSRIQRPSQELRSPTRGPPARQRRHKGMTRARTGVCSMPPICVCTSPPLDSGRSCCCPSVPYRLCAVAGLLRVIGWGRVLYRVGRIWETGKRDRRGRNAWKWSQCLWEEVVNGEWWYIFIQLWPGSSSEFVYEHTGD